MFIDCHNHLQDPRFDNNRDELITTIREAGVARCIVNGTTESDWPAVTSLAESHPDLVIPSYGLHPWYLKNRSKDWLTTLKTLLEANSSAGIGECGLDRWMKNFDINDQISVFRSHLTLGAQFNRSVTIHCLKAWGPLLDTLRESQTLPDRFLLHSFSGSLESANELLKLGAYFSFSGYFLHPRKENVQNIFQQLPGDRVLIETDAPDMLPPDPHYPLEDLNHPANLPDITKRAAKVLNLPPEQFALNAKTFFNL